MTEKKTNPEKEAAQGQGDKKVKATTGAWWKSSVADETKQEVGRREQEPASEVAPEATLPEKKVSRRPARPRRKKADAVPEVIESGLVPRMEEQAAPRSTAVSGHEEAQGGEASAEMSLPPKKSGRRPSRPRKKKTEVLAPSGTAAAEGVPESTATPFEGTEGKIAGDVAQAQPEAAGEKPATPAPAGETVKRPSRPRGRRKKPVSENIEIQDQESAEAPDVGETSVTPGSGQ